MRRKSELKCGNIKKSYAKVFERHEYFHTQQIASIRKLKDITLYV